VAAHLSAAWAERGRAVTLLTTDDGREGSFFELHPAVRHRPLGLRSVSRHPLQALTSNFRRLGILRRAFQVEHPDFIISFLDSNNVMCLLATRGLPRVPTVISERTDPSARSIGFAWEFLRRWTYPWADCLVTQSAHALGYFSPEVQARGRVIPNPVLPLARMEGRSPGTRGPRRLVTTLGRLNRVKGHDLLVEAFASLAPEFPDWDLAIHGEGSERPALEARIRALGLTSRIQLPGATTQVAARLQEADLFVLPSRTEGFPNALAEAMACGLPVVSFDCRSGPSELIRPGVDGVLVPPEDVPGLARAMAGLMGDPAERARLSVQAPEVLNRFSLNRVLELWESALQFASQPHRERTIPCSQD